MCGLGARRHVLATAVVHGAGGAVAEHEDVVIERGLQRGAHHQLVDAVGFQAVQALQEVGGLDARGPDLEAGRDHAPILGLELLGRDAAHRGFGDHLHAQLFQRLVGIAPDAFGQCGQHALAGIEHGDVQVLGRDIAQAIVGQLLRGIAQLGGQLDAGGARADDGDAQLGLLVAARMRREVFGQQLAVKAFRLLGRVEKDAVFRRAGGAEVVGHAAYGHDQRVIGQLARGRGFAAVFVEQGLKLDGLGLAVQTAHPADLELEMLPLGLGNVVELVFRLVQRARGDFVQQRLPHVREVAVHQDDLGLPAFAQALAEPRGQLQSAGAAADDHDAMGHGWFPIHAARGARAGRGSRPVTGPKNSCVSREIACACPQKIRPDGALHDGGRHCPGGM